MKTIIMKKIDLEKLNKIIEDQGRRKNWLAGLLGVKAPQVTYMLNGDRPFKDEHIPKLAFALGVPQKRFLKWIRR